VGDCSAEFNHTPKSKDRLIADYALTNLNRAIGVSTYQTGELPLEIRAELPTVEQLQQALDFSESNSDLSNEGEL